MPMKTTAADSGSGRPVVAIEAESLDNEIAALNEELEILIRRLDPIVRPAAPENPSVAEKDPHGPVSTFASQMIDRRRLISRMRAAVNDTAERLEV